MLELRYNGCSDCLHTAKSLLRNAGYFVNRDYKVTFHSEHKGDRIYEKRPDYLKVFSGAIIYNPDTESWLDIYSSDHTHCDACDLSTPYLTSILKTLKS